MTWTVGARRPARRGRPTPRQLRSSRLLNPRSVRRRVLRKLARPIESTDLDGAWGNFLPHAPPTTSLARTDASHPHAGRRHRRFRYARSAGRRALDRATPRGAGNAPDGPCSAARGRVAVPFNPQGTACAAATFKNRPDCPNSCMGVKKYPTVQPALLFSMSLYSERHRLWTRPGRAHGDGIQGRWGRAAARHRGGRRSAGPTHAARCAAACRDHGDRGSRQRKRSGRADGVLHAGRRRDGSDHARAWTGWPP